MEEKGGQVTNDKYRTEVIIMFRLKPKSVVKLVKVGAG